MEECWMDLMAPAMRYLRAGSGPALSCCTDCWVFLSWRYTMPALASYATVYAPEPVGGRVFGPAAGIDHSMHATALRVLRFVDKLGLASFDLLGTSRGGAWRWPLPRSASARGVSRRGSGGWCWFAR